MKRTFSIIMAVLVLYSTVWLAPEGFAVQVEQGIVFTSVAFNGDSDNPVYIAVGAGGAMYRNESANLSPENWVKIHISDNYSTNLNGVVYNPDDGIFVAGGQHATLLVSTDNGLTWSNKSSSLQSASNGRAIWDLSYKKLSNGTKIFITVHPAKNPATREQAYVGQWNGTGFSWKPLLLSQYNAHSIAWHDDNLLIGSASTPGARGIFHYFDFSDYTGETAPVSPSGLQSVHFTPYPGDNIAGQLKPINGITWFNSKWIAVSGNGGSGQRGGIYISTTTNGIPSGNDGAWTETDFQVRQAPDFPAQFFSVASSEDAVVAVGTGGAIFHSSDGTHYVKKHAGVSADLRHVMYDGSRFIAAGAQGQILWSDDGEDWSHAIPEPYTYTGKMAGNQMLMDESFENLDFTQLTETYRYTPGNDQNDASSTLPIDMTPSQVTLNDHSYGDNTRATTVKLALNDDVYIQPAVSQSRLVVQIENVLKNNNISSKALRIASPDGGGQAVLGFGFNTPQKGTIVLEGDIFYPEAQPNEVRSPRLYAESQLPIVTHDHLAQLINRTKMPYYQLNDDGTGTLTGDLGVGRWLTDGHWRRFKFSVDTETGKVSAAIYRVDGRYAQDVNTYVLNEPGNISYNLESGLLHLGFAADQFGSEGILLDNLKIYRELYYKDPVKPASISNTKIDGTYYQYAIDQANRVIVQRSSKDMITWKDEPPIILNGTWAEWNNAWHDFWAVEMYKFNDKYYLTYSAKKDPKLIEESFENIDFTKLPEINRYLDSGASITTSPNKLELTHSSAASSSQAASLDLELNFSVRLKPVLSAVHQDAQLNIEVVNAPRASDVSNKALKIYSETDAAANTALSFVFNTNYRRGETVFEADVQFPGGQNRRMYAETSMPLVTGEHVEKLIHTPDKAYLEFGGTGAAKMSGGIHLGDFDLTDTWYHLELRVNSETGTVTAAIKDETKSTVLATNHYAFNPADVIKDGVFHVGFADSHLGTEGIIIDNVKIWNTSHASFHRIGLAESDQISGPFTDIGRPLFDTHAAIDSHIFQDTDGTFYLYYSKDVSGNYVTHNGVEERRSDIYGVKLSSDLKRLIGEPVLLATPSEPYERKSANMGMYWNEAPWVHKHNDTYYLFYSANLFNSMYYNLNYATSDSPLGAFTKYSLNPIAQTDGLYSDKILRGLGHNSIVPSPDDSELFIAYVPNQGDGSTGNTAVPFENMGSYFSRMGFRVDGSVYVNGPVMHPQPLPSGINGYTNLAGSATLTASSTAAGHSIEHLTDGEIGIYGKLADLYEWQSQNEGAGAWVKLEWSAPRTITSVAIYDSAKPERQITSGTLTFSNDTVIDVTFPDGHGAAAIATFPPMDASWVTFEVKDMKGSSHAGLSEIVVLGKDSEDVTPPTLEITLDKTTLWPPNHQMVPVHVTIHADDDHSGLKEVVLTSIVSSEPEQGAGDGKTANDIQEAEYGTYDTHFLLRAERSGGGSGRVYTITYTATDNAGNQTTASATVTVPHNRSSQ